MLCPSEPNPLKNKAWKRNTGWMSYSPDLDGTVENSPMEKGVICSGLRAGWDGVRGAVCSRDLEQQQCSASWAVPGPLGQGRLSSQLYHGCTMTFSCPLSDAACVQNAHSKWLLACAASWAVIRMV